MPWKIHKVGNKFCVKKKGSSTCKGPKYSSRKAATPYLKALYTNTKNESNQINEGHYSIADLVTPAEKRVLRKIRNVSSAVKAVVYGGCLAGPMMASQFNNDVRVYGLYEALLYVERYEEEGKYEKGTAMKGLNAAKIPDEDQENPPPLDQRPGWSAFEGAPRESVHEGYTYKLARKPETNEWVVKAYKDGKYDEDATYYTDDKRDAIDTKKALELSGTTDFTEGRSGYYMVGDLVKGPFGDAKILKLDSGTGNCRLQQLERFGNDEEIKPGYRFSANCTELFGFTNKDYSKQGLATPRESFKTIFYKNTKLQEGQGGFPWPDDDPRWDEAPIHPDEQEYPNHCWNCHKMEKPGEIGSIITVDDDPGNPEVGPDPDIGDAWICDDCAAYNNKFGQLPDVPEEDEGYRSGQQYESLQEASSAFSAGRQAFLNHEPISANPFPEHSKQFELWHDGHDFESLKSSHSTSSPASPLHSSVEEFPFVKVISTGATGKVLGTMGDQAKVIFFNGQIEMLPVSSLRKIRASSQTGDLHDSVQTENRFKTVTESILNNQSPVVGYWYEFIKPLYEYRSTTKNKVIALPAKSLTGSLYESIDDKFIRLENELDETTCAYYGMRKADLANINKR